MATVYEFPSGRKIEPSAMADAEEAEMRKHESECSGMGDVGAVWTEREEEKKVRGVKCVITIGHDHPECEKYAGKTSAHQALYPPLRWLIDECGDHVTGFLLMLVKEAVQKRGGGKATEAWLRKTKDVKVELKATRGEE